MISIFSYIFIPQRDDLGLGIMTQRPRNLDYALESTRVATFNHPGWPSNKEQTPALLAKAGFYYAGKK